MSIKETPFYSTRLIIYVETELSRAIL